MTVVALRALTTIASAAVLPCVFTAAADAGPAIPEATYAIDAHIIAAGATVQSGNACYRLQSTLAEPAVGYATSPVYAVSSGFRAVVQTLPRDDLFFSGFEACP